LLAFHPELRRAARILPRGGVRKRALPLVRRGVALMPDRAKDVVIEQISPTASARVFRPRAATTPTAALLWIHGGGLVLGSPLQDDDLCRRIVKELGIVVAAVKYRLAPEHPYPAALDDCHDALAWLAGRPDVEATRVAVGGASAGGGLAAAVALAARERGAVAPVLQLLTYPMLDDRTGLRTELDAVPTRMWDNQANRFGWSSYLGKPAGSDGVSGFAAPARAEDLSGLAPAWIGVGTRDLFHDEDLSYADRLRAAGVPCEVDVVEGGFHAFDRFCPKTEVSRQFLDKQLAALRGALHG
jgi:acetyl esterase/lipase